MAVGPTVLIAAIAAQADAPPPSTWVALAPLPGAGKVPVFAMAVDPINDRAVIAGGGGGGLFRSADGGATWRQVQLGHAPVLTIAYSPFSPTLVLAGTRGAGAYISGDGGVQWSGVGGLGSREVRAFGFARTMIVAATDKGVYASDSGESWTSLGLSTSSIDAIAVAAINPPVRLVAGGDSGPSGTVPLWTSGDAGATWGELKPAISGTIVTKLAAGPLAPNSAVRPLVLGTNTGLFISEDNGNTFTSLSSGALLPSTDYTQIGFTSTHHDRFYVASDGGGGESGGLYATADSGQHFSSLQPPLPAITALAVSGDEQPILYAATFRSFDHGVVLWSYHDTGGAPQQPVGSTTPSASGARPHTSPSAGFDLMKFLGATQAPYIALGVVALAVLLLAVVSQIRSRRR